jgi:phosphinothricin acetyltransferase
MGLIPFASLFALLILQGLNHAYAGITLPNPASVGLHESLGFEPVRVYHAVGYKRGPGTMSAGGSSRCKPM